MSTNTFIDMHMHVLPGVDDGPDTMEQSVALLTQAYADGSRAIVATPHYREALGFAARPEQLRKLCAEVTAYAAREGRPIPQIYLGQEIYYTSDTPAMLASENLMTIAGTRYVLVEFSSAVHFQDLKNGLYTLLQAGYRPILAHAERYHCLYGGKDRLWELVDLGIYLQLNAESVLSRKYRIRRFCQTLLRAEAVHFVASDAHDCHDRPPRLFACAGLLNKKFGTAMTERLLSTNAERILAGENI